MSSKIDYKKIRSIINRYSAAISQLQVKQNKLIKDFYELADKEKIKQAKDRIKK